MSVETSIVTRATTHVGLAALIGTRCYPEDPGRTAVLPYLVYQRVSTVPHQAMGNCPANTARFQLDGYAATKVAALALRVQILAAFDHCGIQGDIQDSLWADEHDLGDLMDTEAKMKVISLDFEVTS
jgi:hypothetical protein